MKVKMYFISFPEFVRMYVIKPLDSSGNSSRIYMNCMEKMVFHGQSQGTFISISGYLSHLHQPDYPSLVVKICEDVCHGFLVIKPLDSSGNSFSRKSPLHVKQRNEEDPQAASGWCPDGLGRRGPGELRPQTKPGPEQHSPLDRPTSTRGKRN
jgi:hypothetical protein